MAEEEVRKKWYEALFDGDCVRVRDLLKSDRRLLKVGWTSEASREFDRRDASGRQTSTKWEGRNALHVAAWRGCVELVKLVLTVSSNLTEIESLPRVDQQGAVAGSEKREDIIAAATVGQLHQRGETNDQTVADGDDSASEGGEQNVQNRGEDAVLEVVSTSEFDEKGLQLAPQILVERDKVIGTQGAWCLLKRMFSKRKKTNNLQKSASSGSSAGRHSPAPLPRLDEDHDSSTVSGDSLSSRESASSGSPAPRHSPAPLPRLDEDHDSSTVSRDSFSSRDLRELLLAKDGYFGLEPLPMAALHFNVDIMVLLAYAYGECGIYPKPIKSVPKPGHLVLVDVEESGHRDKRARLRQATKKVIKSFDGLTSCLKLYDSHTDFNFLPVEEYLFHFLCACGRAVSNNVLDALWREVRLVPDELWRFLLELHDGQGRTPAHVALDSKNLDRFLELVTKCDDVRNVLLCAMSAPDGASRTLAHRATATGALTNGLDLLLNFARGFPEVSAICCAELESSKEAAAFNSRNDSPEFRAYLTLATEIMERYTSENGFRLERSPRPLQAAILTKNYECAKVLMEIAFRRSGGAYIEHHVFEDGNQVEFDTMNFACLAGADIELIKYIKEKNVATSKGSVKPMTGKEIPTLHLVASYGNYELLTLLIDNFQYDPFVEDFEGNTTLHHALGMREFKFRPYFLDYVSCQHIQKCPERAEKKRLEYLPSEEKKTWDENQIVEREGCINLLLQLGCDVFIVNKKKEVPYPKGTLSRNAKFRSWWYEKQEREFAAIQNNLNFAANAISVIATLVATASYNGPLQPPMGYAGDPNQIQDQNIWVLIFIVCDNISFYLAIAAITFSLSPSLPMPQQSMAGELQRTRRMVTLAVAILFPAIIFVFVAYGSSAFAVQSASLTSSAGGDLMIATAFVGGSICLGGFCLFFMRLLAFGFPRNTWVRYFYDHTPI